jgi:hypothetical protein
MRCMKEWASAGRHGRNNTFVLEIILLPSDLVLHLPPAMPRSLFASLFSTKQ